MEYTQEGEQIPEGRRDYRKMLGIGAGILLVAGSIFILENMLHVHIVRYAWPIILVVISVGAVLRQIFKGNGIE